MVCFLPIKSSLKQTETKTMSIESDKLLEAFVKPIGLLLCSAHQVSVQEARFILAGSSKQTRKRFPVRPFAFVRIKITKKT